MKENLVITINGIDQDKINYEIEQDPNDKNGFIIKFKFGTSIDN